MLKICGIYAIQNNLNGNVYIGKSKNIKDRMRKHRYELNANKHYNKHLQRSWVKHGRDNFEFSILEQCSVDELPEREQHWINTNIGKLFNTEINVKDHNHENNNFFGKKHSEESKRKMSESRKGKLNGADNPNYGNVISDDVRRKMSTNRATKLNPESVLEIKQLLSKGEKHLDIANRFGVCRTIITRINSGARWSTVKEEE